MPYTISKNTHNFNMRYTAPDKISRLGTSRNPSNVFAMSFSNFDQKPNKYSLAKKKIICSHNVLISENIIVN